MATVTRADLTDAVHRETGLPRRDAAALVNLTIETIAERLSAGERVAISGLCARLTGASAAGESPAGRRR